ncbi:efflux RND transporter periplasmic adaptor subunit [Methylomicrobium sp. Wu6]|uniref:efflux RND transporter periplasmic adaptor subunit n=1 Tax=Methylomicrobium sp. Wu6 TaxID=3107928 RepID=UPI002DD6588A|nr:efflux RND transporter periplasmic adaptor subunit [Methylomicrobium sp. Wu6]MEC4748084.1 efflux RND transporter periplasmic adaptor subunit [Methylomicrobium sp. Wu6]
MQKKWLCSAGALFALLLLIVWMLGLIGGDKTEPGNTPLPAQAATTKETARVERRTIKDAQPWPGTVRALSEARIAPKINARILTVAVHEGDRVKQGAVLARLDAEQNRALEHEAESRAAAARAEAARAATDLLRTHGLFEQEAATREAYERAETNARKAQASAQAAEYSVREAAIQRGETVLRAPFDGVIAKRLHEPGDMGLSGEPIVILQKESGLRLEASVPASCANRIKIGDAATVRIDALKTSLSARINEIVPAADPDTGTVLIKAGLPEIQGLQPGLFGWLEQACGIEHTALLIPAATLRRIGQIEVVTVQDGAKLSTRHVRSGFSQGDRVEILSGVDEGETVVIQ